MSEATVSQLPKPQLRGLLRSSLRFHLLVAGVLSVGGALAFRYGVAEPRKRRYAEFYKNYDAKKAFEEMKQAGVFKSVPANK